MSQIAALLAALALGFAGSMFYEKDRAKVVMAEAIAQQVKENAERDREVVNGWAAAVDLLRARIRHGDAPRIPVSGPSAPAPAAGGVDAGTTDFVSVAGELGADLNACRAERQRVIEDCAVTTIQLRALQGWAR